MYPFEYTLSVLPSTDLLVIAVLLAAEFPLGGDRIYVERLEKFQFQASNGLSVDSLARLHFTDRRRAIHTHDSHFSVRFAAAGVKRVRDRRSQMRRTE